MGVRDLGKLILAGMIILLVIMSRVGICGEEKITIVRGILPHGKFMPVYTQPLGLHYARLERISIDISNRTMTRVYAIRYWQTREYWSKPWKMIPGSAPVRIKVSIRY